MIPAQLRVKLVNALTEFDRRASTRKGYNPYALGQYCAALQSADELVSDGSTVRAAIVRQFNDRLRDALLRSIGEPDYKRFEEFA